MRTSSGRRKFGTQSVLILMFSAIVVVLSVSYTVLLIQYRTRDVIKLADFQLLTAAAFSWELLGHDYHDRINDEKSVSNERFAQIVARNDYLCRIMDIQYLWSVLVTDGDIVFTSGTHSDLRDPASACATFFENHSDPASFAPALEPGSGTVFSTFDNEWGKGRQVLIPHQDILGRTYIFGASMQLTKFDAMISRTVLIACGVGLAAILLAILLSVPLSRFVVSPIKTLTEGANLMAVGNFDIILAPSRIRELHSLSVSLGTMRTNLTQYMDRLRESELRQHAVLQRALDGFWRVSLDGRIIEVNQAYCEMSGYTEEELLRMRIPDVEAEESKTDTEAHMSTIIQRGWDRFESRHRRKDGSFFDIETSVQFRKEQGGTVYAFLHDTTERKLADARIRKSLEEKTTLLKELHHRTKNNMGIIMALLDLQAEELDDERLRAALSDTKNRIKSMAMVHRMIYEANDLSRLDLGDYVRELVNILVRSFERKPGKIAIEENLESFPVLIDIAIPCGLILTELVTNALKHAFPGGEGGRITLTLHRANDGAIELGIADSGPGFVAGFDPRRDGHLGLQTVLALAENQLGGKVEISGDNGVRWLISFEESAFKARI